MTADPTRPPSTAAAGGPRVLIAAGGTGGHVFPGLALARTLQELDPSAEVHFAGTSRGIENREVPAAGFPLHLLPILPLSRRLSVQSALSPFAAVAGAVAAWRLLRRLRIEAVAGMGGYVTLPVAAGARLAGVPVVLHEQNAIPGIANRLAARLARRVALGVAEAGAAFPAAKTEVVGNPTKPELTRLDRNRVREQGVEAFGLDPERRTLFVFGGSQGARHLNQAVVGATGHWPDPKALQVLHACGRRDEAAVREAWRAAKPEERGLKVVIVPFIERMELAYAACDLAVTRAGAMTMAELTNAGVPAVMVPLPHATADHQAANARAVAAAGGAVVVRDADLDGEKLAAVAAPLLEDPERLAKMSVAAASLARPAAGQELAALVLEATGRGSRESFLAATPAGISREDAGWFEAIRVPGGPEVSRRVDRRSRRLEAYPPIEERRKGAPPSPGAAPEAGPGAPSPGRPHAAGPPEAPPPPDQGGEGGS